jgi:hypothetical protein
MEHIHNVIGFLIFCVLAGQAVHMVLPRKFKEHIHMPTRKDDP